MPFHFNILCLVNGYCLRVLAKFSSIVLMFCKHELRGGCGLSVVSLIWAAKVCTSIGVEIGRVGVLGHNSLA